jgi:predicted TIM-barrel fold metal-dependent hydrolase
MYHNLNLSLPLKTCDTHVHVFDPSRYPYAAERSYTPGSATCSELLTMMAQLGSQRVVLVQPSVYGDDNRCMLQALLELGFRKARGVAVINARQISAEELARLHHAGVRGVRLNSTSAALKDAHRLQLEFEVMMQALSAHAVCQDWHVQLHARISALLPILQSQASLSRPVVLDHYAGCWFEDEEHDSMLATILDLMRHHRQIYVKLSAPYRLQSSDQLAHMLRMARAFAQAAPEQILWGTDWPHTGGQGQRSAGSPSIEPFREIDNAYWQSALLDCMPDAATRQRLLADNAASLYGF